MKRKILAFLAMIGLIATFGILQAAPASAVVTGVCDNGRTWTSFGDEPITNASGDVIARLRTYYARNGSGQAVYVCGVTNKKGAVYGVSSYVAVYLSGDVLYHSNSDYGNYYYYAGPTYLTLNPDECVRLTGQVKSLANNLYNGYNYFCPFYV